MEMGRKQSVEKGKVKMNRMQLTKVISLVTNNWNVEKMAHERKLSLAHDQNRAVTLAADPPFSLLFYTLCTLSFFVSKPVACLLPNFFQLKVIICKRLVKQGVEKYTDQG